MSSANLGLRGTSAATNFAAELCRVLDAPAAAADPALAARFLASRLSVASDPTVFSLIGVRIGGRDFMSVMSVALYRLLAVCTW